MNENTATLEPINRKTNDYFKSIEQTNSDWNGIKYITLPILIINGLSICYGVHFLQKAYSEKIEYAIAFFVFGLISALVAIGMKWLIQSIETFDPEIFKKYHNSIEKNTKLKKWIKIPLLSLIEIIADFRNLRNFAEKWTPLACSWASIFCFLRGLFPFLVSICQPMP